MSLLGKMGQFPFKNGVTIRSLEMEYLVGRVGVVLDRKGGEDRGLGMFILES